MASSQQVSIQLILVFPYWYIFRLSIFDEQFGTLFNKTPTCISFLKDRDITDILLWAYKHMCGIVHLKQIQL